MFKFSGSAKRQRRGLPGLVEAFVKQCASQLEDSGADALSKAVRTVAHSFTLTLPTKHAYTHSNCLTLRLGLKNFESCFSASCLQEALACARALVQRAGASVSPEAVVSAANEGGFLLSRDGKWQLHAPSVRSL